MTGLWVVLAAVAVAGIFGGYRRFADGRARAVRTGPSLDASRLGADLGRRATFVQFSSQVCAGCRATRRVLAGLGEPGVVHVELDAQSRMDLVDEFHITRTPTVLLLDADGVVRQRIAGAVRRDQALAALHQVTGPPVPSHP